MSADSRESVNGPAEPRSRHPLLVWAWSLLRLKFLGVAFGALFFCLSLTPSLLPRDWLFQGLIGGVNAAFGYGLGVLIGRPPTASCCETPAGGRRRRGCCAG